MAGIPQTPVFRHQEERCGEGSLDERATLYEEDAPPRVLNNNHYT